MNNSRSIRTMWDQLAEVLSKPPIVRAIEALRAWCELADVRTALLAMHEWATVDSCLQGYRERWQQQGIPISLKEAEYALHCLGYAVFNEQVEPGQYLTHKLGKDPSKELIVSYIEHAECKAPYWDALAAYKEPHGTNAPALLSEWPPSGAKRPKGKGRPPRWMFRDEVLIPEAIRKLKGCGLPVTSASGLSIAAAVARVFGLTERNVAAIWESAPSRFDKRSRQRYSNHPCHICGKPKVPMYRESRDDFRCKDCAPPLC